MMLPTIRLYPQSGSDDNFLNILCLNSNIALCEIFSEFSSGHICAFHLGLGHFHLDGANLQMQTHLVPKIMHQNLAINLWQFNYSKNSFIVLVPGIESLVIPHSSS